MRTREYRLYDVVADCVDADALTQQISARSATTAAARFLRYAYTHDFAVIANTVEVSVAV